MRKHRGSKGRRPTGRGRTSGLGEHCSIPRRDFVQGMLVGAAAALTGPLLSAPASALGSAVASALHGALGAQDKPGYYPPTLRGLRGSHPGSFETAHRLRDGGSLSAAVDSGESYDLVVVGAGISGLAAAHFFRREAGAAGRTLVLDNHDDFGGHAKRNEFDLGGRTALINGGTLSIDSPRPYSTVADGLLREIGIDVPALSGKLEDKRFYRNLGLKAGVFFDRDTFGADHLAIGLGAVPMATLLAKAPLSARAREDIARIEEQEIDYLPGLTNEEKKRRLLKISYRDYLRDLVKADPAALAYYQARTQSEWGVGADAVAALEVWGFGFPGFKGLHLTGGSIPGMGPTASGYRDTGGSYSLHFPDGNATIARLLVRKLIPEAVPGDTAQDVVTARVDYSRLDRPSNGTRLRLSSTVVNVKQESGPSSAGAIRVTYVRDGKAYTVRAGGCVLACYNMMIPYLVPELPEAQQAALHQLVKAPLVYTSVALRDWRSFEKLGVSSVYAPGCYHTSFSLNQKVDVGEYRSASKADEPMLLRMVRTPCQPGLPEHEQNKAGRADLLQTPFATFERNIRDQLARTLAGGGFDPARDIIGITVNRWPHGYAPEHNPLWQPHVPEEQRPYVLGRAPFGRITIANSDSGGQAYTDSAIDQAHRAVHELLRS